MKLSFTNLPLELTSFIGRERERSEVRELLIRSRLVTLTGSGGSGKTRLALRVGAELLDSFADGVWFIELASLKNSAQLVGEVTSIFHIRESASRSITTQLVNYLEDKDLLLILDNCEHLIQACAELVQTLLKSCPRLKVLATSREVLRTPGEIYLSVPTLSIPEIESLSSSGTRMQSEAVRLFVERAAAVEPKWQLTERNAQRVAQICRRLDGMPLAIELAAARVKVLSTTQIAERLDDQFRLLVGVSRTAVPRHQTLRACIHWSYELLSDAERTLFARLSVFVGGFTLEAVEQVCADRETSREAKSENRLQPLTNPLPVPSSAVLDLLSNLVDKSLVVAKEQEGEKRYHMLETIRLYAREKIDESGEWHAVREYHLDFFLQLAEQAEPKLKGAEQIRWLDILEMELDNVRVAWEWAIEHDLSLALRLECALLDFRWRRAYLAEGREWSISLITLTEKWGDSSLRAQALNAAGLIANRQGEGHLAREFLEESLAIARRIGDQQCAAFALAELGYSSIKTNPETAHSYLAESLALYRELGDDWQIAFQLEMLGVAFDLEGNSKQGQMLHARSISIFRELGDKLSLVYPLNSLGEIALLEGDYGGALSFFQECVEIDRESGLINHLVLAAFNLGKVLFLQGAYQGARVLFQESLELVSRRGAKDLMVLDLLGMTGVISALGKREQAARLLGAAESKFEDADLHIEAADRLLYDHVVSSVRAQLDDSSYERMWLEGHTMTVEQAIEYALVESDTVDQVVTPPSATGSLPHAQVAPALSILALGPTRVYRGDRELVSTDWKYAKAREMLLYLLCSPARTKEQIGVALWPDASPAQLYNNFRVVLYHVRQALGSPEWVVFESDQYSFNRSLNYRFDVEAFESACTLARQLHREHPAQALAHLQEATGIYRGDFLEDWSEGEWYLSRREELRREYLEALLLMGGLLFEDTRYAEAAETYRQAIDKDNYLEEAHRELMRCYVRLGERGRALRQYQDLVGLLRDELGAPPSRETKALFERLKRGAEG